MRTARRLLVGLTAVTALALGPTSAASAAPDMQLSPNFTECAPADYPSNCSRTIGVEGSGFPASTAVGLYWMEPQFFLLAAGWPGTRGQELSGTACTELGHGPLATPASVVTDGSGGFTTEIVGPPTDAVYGANAVCAVWVSGGAYRGVGNQYTIYPF